MKISPQTFGQGRPSPHQIVEVIRVRTRFDGDLRSPSARS